METRANYLIVGLFVLGLVGMLVLLIIWFSAGNHQQRSIYLVYVNESVSGLNVQSTVKFNGVNVGYVSNISLDSKDAQRVRIELEINDGTPINQSTRAVLQTQGITGVMFVGLQAGAADAPPLRRLPGEKYPVIESTPSLLMQVDAAVREMAVTFKGVGGSVDELLSAKNQLAIQQSLANLAVITSALASRSSDIENSMDSLTATLNETKKTMQGFSQQVMPGMTQTFSQLTRLLAELGPTARIIKNNPSVLVRGSAPARLGPGE